MAFDIRLQAPLNESGAGGDGNGVVAGAKLGQVVAGPGLELDQLVAGPDVDQVDAGPELDQVAPGASGVERLECSADLARLDGIRDRSRFEYDGFCLVGSDDELDATVFVLLGRGE